MNALFAQRAQRNFNNAPQGPPEEVLIVAFVIVGVIVLVVLAVYIAFLLTLSKALKQCHSQNRTIEPGMVWLNLVPCLSIVWQFITVNRVAESLRNEFRDRRMSRREEDYGHGVGMAACVLNLVGAIPYIGAFFGLAGLVCGIIYWVKIAGYSRQLAMDDGYNDGHDDKQDDYDDRDRRRKDDDYDDRDRRRKDDEEDYDRYHR